MDKRSLVAILITFGILIAWQMIYVRPRQQEAAMVRIEQARADSIAMAEAVETRTVEPSEAEREAVAKEAPAQETARGPEAGDFFGGNEEEVSITVDTGPMLVRLKMERKQ